MGELRKVRAVHSRSIIALALCAALACAPHVTLRAPPATASTRERVDAYQALRPRNFTEVVTVSMPPGMYGGGLMGQADRETLMELGDGTRVYHPSDLLPLVAPESETAKAAGEYASLDRTQQYIGLIGGGLSIGSAISAFGLAVAAGERGEKTIPDSAVGCAAGALVSGLVAWIASLALDHEADEKTKAAFSAYEHDLLAALNLRKNVSETWTDVVDTGTETKAHRAERRLPSVRNLTLTGDSTCPSPAEVGASLVALRGGLAAPSVAHVLHVDGHEREIAARLVDGNGAVVGERTFARREDCMRIADELSLSVATWLLNLEPHASPDLETTSSTRSVAKPRPTRAPFRSE